MMVVPMIHRLIRRDDLARLVTEIAHTNPQAAYRAARAMEAGQVDRLLDLPIALEAVRGRGGTPAPLPLTLLWYVPVRATLRQLGEDDITIADYTATLPVAFVSTSSFRHVAHGDPAITAWTQSIEELPASTVVQGERAAYCGALALWWVGCFPERIEKRGGSGMLRAYVDFAASALRRASTLLYKHAPETATLYAQASERASTLTDALSAVRRDYLGTQAHTSDGRLSRFLSRLSAEGDAA